jgi:uncharacterized membrane protein
MSDAVTLSFESPTWLLLVGAVPFLVWAARRTLTNFPPQQRTLQTGARALLVTLIALAASRPVWNLDQRRISVVYLVDVSTSISPAAIDRAARWIEDAHRRSAPDHWRIVAFGAASAPVASLEALRSLAGTTGAGADVPPATNIARALDEARAGFAPRHLRRIVLFSDGRPTAGGDRDAIARLQDEGIQVHTVALAPRDAGDTWVDDVHVPAHVTAGETFAVDVAVVSQAPRTVTVDVRHRGRVIASKSLGLPSGRTAVSLDARLPDSGAAVVEARLRSDDDPVEANNVLRRPVHVQARRKVLYAEGRPQSARHLRDALEANGFDVTVASGASVPRRAAALDAFDAVVLSDVDARTLPAETMRAVADYVGARGGGLVMAGGEAVFGEQGYSGTPIERALPVTFDVKEPPDEVAVVIVLDKSWSMFGTTIELAKEACKAAVDVLADHHQVGLVAFNHDFDWPVRLQRAENREQIKARIAAIEPSGHTVIYPALDAAFQALRGVSAITRHVILLSDGRTYDDPYESLVTRMAEARITVSTVAVGPEADRTLLGNIARWGQGRAYAFANAREVPQIFVKETERVTRRAVDEGVVSPVVRQPAGILRDLGIASAPPLRGYTRVRARETAELLLATPSDDPLLARWQFGLGRAVMFASDVKERWAAGWLGWPGYAPFWTRVVRDVMRRPDTRGGLRVERAIRADGQNEARIAFEAIDPAGGFADVAPPRVEIAGGERIEEVVLPQRAPGRFEATVPLAEGRDYLVRAVVDRAESLAPWLPLSAFALAPPADEYRFRPPDVAFLRALSEATGGVFDPSPERVVEPGAQSSRVPVAVWPWLVGVALVLYLIDLLLRRVRLFEAAADPGRA